MTLKKINNKSLLWQPHNFRIYYDYTKETFKQNKPNLSILKATKNAVPKFNAAYTYSPKNHDSEHLYKNFMCCTIEVKKEQIVVHNRIHTKQWRHIQANNPAQVKARIDEVITRMKAECKQALQVFIRTHGGKSQYKELKFMCEHGIHGDDFLDKIPQEMIINDAIFQKVYDHKVEFTDSTAIKTYITNRSIEEIAPEIARSINRLAKRIGQATKTNFLDHIFNNNLTQWFNKLTTEAQNQYIKNEAWT